MARGSHEPARRGDLAGDRASLRPRRASAAARPPVLVPVVRRRDGHGLAFLGHHHQRDRRAEARAEAARKRARPACLRRARRAFAADAAGARRDRREDRLRRRPACGGEPARRQGGQRRGAGRVRALSARLHRRRRRQMGRRAAGHEGRDEDRAALSLAVGRAEELCRRPARGDRRAAAGRDRQPRRPPRGEVAPARSWSSSIQSGRTGSPASFPPSKGRAPRPRRPRSRCCRISSCPRITTCGPATS